MGSYVLNRLEIAAALASIPVPEGTVFTNESSKDGLLGRNESFPHGLRHHRPRSRVLMLLRVALMAVLDRVLLSEAAEPEIFGLGDVTRVC